MGLKKDIEDAARKVEHGVEDAAKKTGHAVKEAGKDIVGDTGPDSKPLPKE